MDQDLKDEGQNEGLVTEHNIQNSDKKIYNYILQKKITTGSYKKIYQKCSKFEIMLYQLLSTILVIIFWNFTIS